MYLKNFKKVSDFRKTNIKPVNKIKILYFCTRLYDKYKTFFSLGFLTRKYFYELHISVKILLFTLIS